MPLTWTHTWPEGGPDFTAYEGDRRTGRVHKHHDGRWLWAAWYWNGTGSVGIETTKAAAVDALKTEIERMPRVGPDRRNP